MFNLNIEPLIPMSLWLAMAVCAAAMLFWYARRRPGAISQARWWLSIGLSAAGVCGVLIVLLNPTWVRPLPPPPGKPVLTVLVDASASMATPDSGDASRYATAAKIAQQVNASLSDTFDVQIKAFDRDVRTTDAQVQMTPEGLGTDLAGALSSALSVERVAGEAVLLLSDGIHNTGGGSTRVLDAVRVAKAMGAPIYTRTIGGEVQGLDVAVTIRSPQDIALIGQRVPLTAQVANTGFGGGRVEVALLKNGKEITRKTADLSGKRSDDVHFMLAQDEVGVHPYEVRIDPVPGEASQANNSASYVLRVVQEPIRVLVLEGKPYWDNKFFTRTLSRDPAIALDSVVKLSEKRLLRRLLTHKSGEKKSDEKGMPERDETWQIAGDPSEFLASPEKLRFYQIIVMGRDSETFLNDTAMSNLQDWISRSGGSLVCYRGSPTAPANQKLSKLLPVRYAATPARGDRFRIGLTERGQQLDWFRPEGAGRQAFDPLVGMPSLARSTLVESAKPLAVVLASSSASDGSNSPAVVYQPYGAGRVVVIEGTGMWRWAFLSPQYQQQEEVYTSLWHSLMRWLTNDQHLQPGQMFSLRGDKVRFGTMETASVTLLTRQDIDASKLPDIELSIDGQPGGPVKRFRPTVSSDEIGTYRVNFGKLGEARYRAQIAGAKNDDPTSLAIFEVRRFDQEHLDLQARPDLMARIATDSGGLVLGNKPAAEIARAFKAHQAKSRVEQLERSPAWDRWWVLTGVLGIWAMTWFVRRAGGLV